MALGMGAGALNTKLLMGAVALLLGVLGLWLLAWPPGPQDTQAGTPPQAPVVRGDTTQPATAVTQPGPGGDDRSGPSTPPVQPDEAQPDPGPEVDAGAEEPALSDEAQTTGDVHAQAAEQMLRAYPDADPDPDQIMVDTAWTALREDLHRGGWVDVTQRTAAARTSQQQIEVIIQTGARRPGQEPEVRVWLVTLEQPDPPGWSVTHIRSALQTVRFD